MVTEQQSQLPVIPLEEFIRHFESLTLAIDIAVGVVKAISITRGFIMYLKLLRRSPLGQTKEEEGIKRFVGSALILALDLEVGSDIIKTILTPTDNELISLAVIVAIRIILSWSLPRDVKTT